MPESMDRVLLLGDPRLREVSRPVQDVADPGFVEQREHLARMLAWFRQKWGFGRAIAAPQVGVPRRFIAMNLGQGPFCVINPQITWSSDQTFTMWDDCMSFPDLLVRVRRHQSISIRYVDEKGVEQSWERIDLAASELLQHEIDHLDGILAIDRALDRDSIVLREVYEEHHEAFRQQVDYVIGD